MTVPLPVPVAAHAGAHGPPSVSLKCASPHAFRVQRLGGPTRWFRRIGYTLAILSGDHDFDERWSVESNDHEFAQALVRERDARAAIAQLDVLGCQALGHTRRKLVATFNPRRRSRAEREQQEQALREQLSALDGVIARLCRRHSFPHDGGRARVAVLAVLLSLALMAGLAGLAFGADELLDGELGWLTLKSLLVSLPLTLVLGVVMAWLLAGRSNSHRELLMTLFLAVLSLPTLGVGAALTINRLADEGPTTMRRLPVLELKDRRGDGDHVTHFAVVPEWEPDRGPTRWLKVGRSVSAEAKAGQSWLRLTTSPGRLGAVRVLELRLEDAAGP